MHATSHRHVTPGQGPCIPPSLADEPFHVWTLRRFRPADSAALPVFAVLVERQVAGLVQDRKVSAA
jgi:hypothetical protein